MAPKPAEKEPATEKEPAEKDPAMEKEPAEKEPATEKSPATAGKKPEAEKRLPAEEEPAEKKGKRRKETYKVHIYRVLKQIHKNEVGITSKAMAAMNSFVNDMFDRLAAEAGKLARYNKKSTIGTREIRTSVRLLLPGDLSKMAFKDGDAAVDRFKKYTTINVSDSP